MRVERRATVDEDSATDDLRLEVTPLTPPPAVSGSPTHLAGSQKRLWRAALVGCVVVIGLAVVFSGYVPLHTSLTGWALPQPTATSTPEPTPVLFSKVPTNCPPGNTVETFSPSFGPGVGVYGLHIWFVGFDGPQATVRFTSAPLTQYGWPYKLILAAAPDVTQQIILSAQGMGGVQGRVWFSVDGLDNPTSPTILNPQLTPPQSDGWRSWLMYILLPSSGCFYLDVQSGAAHTGTYFAAGV
jgi:hypothetical protein